MRLRNRLVNHSTFTQTSEIAGTKTMEGFSGEEEIASTEESRPVTDRLEWEASLIVVYEEALAITRRTRTRSKRRDADIAVWYACRFWYVCATNIVTTAEKRLAFDTPSSEVDTWE